ncbi:MAG: CCA tRNA nucleotidyltransferase [Planctomycetota bacterium]|nr:CCA tRNA nucleotidyltransferase [Planctomycetota bacterium]
MIHCDPTAARNFAIHVVKRLREEGYQAFWAGGCVRDHLLGVSPHDYDVATGARPDEIRALFGKRRTLALGAAFGVITVLGRKVEGQVEVATFRSDHGYSDGRHPDHVTFSSPEEDAKRRDFTINGMFYDPLEGRVIDYVGGEEDLRQRRIRAIGDPAARFAEDQLRLLRAIRFTAVLEAELDPETSAAVTRWAPQIGAVSGERVAEEMRRMLVHQTRARAADLLRRCGLLDVILPESRPPEESGERWTQILSLLEALQRPSFSVALAALLWEPQHVELAGDRVAALSRRWRLSNAESATVLWVLQNAGLVLQGNSARWPQLQRVLIHPQIQELMVFARGLAESCHELQAAIAYSQKKLAQDPVQLNPPPLISGTDLADLGIPPGPIYSNLLTSARDAQLDDQVQDRETALQLVEGIWRNKSATRSVL